MLNPNIFIINAAEMVLGDAFSGDRRYNLIWRHRFATNSSNAPWTMQYQFWLKFDFQWIQVMAATNWNKHGKSINFVGINSLDFVLGLSLSIWKVTATPNGKVEKQRFILMCVRACVSVHLTHFIIFTLINRTVLILAPMGLRTVFCSSNPETWINDNIFGQIIRVY